MMKVSTTNDNGSNAFAKNLMAPISFYPNADGSSGLDDEKCSEHDCDMMVHKVCYNPTNVDSQMYKIYLNPFDTGSVEQWLKFLMKLNLIITGNGLKAGLAKFNLMCCYLRVRPCDISTIRLKNSKLRLMRITKCALMQSLSTFSPTMLFRCRNTTCKGPSSWYDDH